MTDKVQKICEGVKRLKSQLLRGACSSQIAMETRCKEEAYDEVFSMLNALQEEPASEDLEEAAKHYLYSNILYDDVYVGNPTDKDCIEMFKAGANWKEQKMMKDAVDGKIYETQARSKLKATTIGKISSLDYRVGDKVKLIIIKED